MLWKILMHSESLEAVLVDYFVRCYLFGSDTKCRVERKREKWKKVDVIRVRSFWLEYQFMEITLYQQRVFLECIFPHMQFSHTLPLRPKWFKSSLLFANAARKMCATWKSSLSVQSQNRVYYAYVWVCVCVRSFKIKINDKMFICVAGYRMKNSFILYACTEYVRENINDYSNIWTFY